MVSATVASEAVEQRAMLRGEETALGQKASDPRKRQEKSRKIVVVFIVAALVSSVAQTVGSSRVEEL